jgi:hypothetical protein
MSIDSTAGHSTFSQGELDAGGAFLDALVRDGNQAVSFTTDELIVLAAILDHVALLGTWPELTQGDDAKILEGLRGWTQHEPIRYSGAR